MATPRQFLRPAWIALVATLAALLTGDGRSARAGTTPGRMAQTRRAGCCCPTLPAGGCCCEPAAPAGPADNSSGMRRAVERFSSLPLRIESTRPSGTCQCRSSSSSAPIADPDRPTTEPRPDLRSETLVVRSSRDVAGVLAANVSRDVGRFGACPLYLGLSRLLF